MLIEAGHHGLRRVKERGFPDVPIHIAKAANEVHGCFRAKMFRAVGPGARGVLEATVKQKGITGKNIAEKIDNLAIAGYIGPKIQEAAHEIRLFGNDMAHGDFAAEVDADRASAILDLMDDVLNGVYQAPAAVARARQLRLGLGKATIQAVPVQTPAGTKTDWDAIARGLKYLEYLAAAARVVAYLK